MTKRVAILLVLVALLVSATAAVAYGSPREDFSLEKTCLSSTYPDPEAVACDITDATGPWSMFNGGWILYEDRVYWEKGDKVREIARVHLVTPAGDTLRGQIRWLDDQGMFTFSKGTGQTAGYHANGQILFEEVASDGRYVFSLTGSYHIENQ
jgi:hypothetical protein